MISKEGHCILTSTVQYIDYYLGGDGKPPCPDANTHSLKPFLLLALTLREAR